ncbi:MAG: hypothetical protein BGO43_06325 [Gammaproteobacteria bacterium 39-13]|nr:hypothetical protein [Gammaproteobacteria bacterium]OJV90462.1 MAG: hypothetical protein BGO43_06325 [Gammaproteobacteria bacterium 39-13]
MRLLHSHEQVIISAGCMEGACLQTTLEFLNNCSYSQMQQINVVFKSIILSDEMKGADEATLKAALINAIQNMSF